MSPIRTPTDGPSIYPVDPNFHTQGMGNVTMYIIATLICCAITLFSVLTVVLIRPENKDAVTTIMAFMVPVIMAFMTAAVYGVQKGVNGRFSQLLSATADMSERTGRAKVIRRLYWQLQQMDPMSNEAQALAAQIQAESMRHFEAVDQRTAPVAPIIVAAPPPPGAPAGSGGGPVPVPPMTPPPAA